MLNITIDNQTFTYISSAKIDDKCYIYYTDANKTYISAFHDENDIMVIENIDDKTLSEVKEILEK